MLGKLIVIILIRRLYNCTLTVNTIGIKFCLKWKDYLTGSVKLKS